MERCDYCEKDVHEDTLTYFCDEYGVLMLAICTVGCSLPPKKEEIEMTWAVTNRRGELITTISRAPSLGEALHWLWEKVEAKGFEAQLSMDQSASLVVSKAEKFDVLTLTEV